MILYHYYFNFRLTTLLIIISINISFLNTYNVKAEWMDVSDKSILENIFSIKFINADTGFCIGSSGSSAILMKTINGGGRWKIHSFQGKIFFNINVKNIDTFFISGYSFDKRCGILIRCFNFGENFEEIYFNDTTNPFSFGINKSIILNNNTMLLCGYSGAIFESEDFGKSWKPTSTNSSSKIFVDIQMLNDSIGFAAAGDIFYRINQIYKTIDSGKSWNQVLFFDSSFNVNISNICFTNEAVAYIFGAKDSKEAILKTVDSMKNWNIVYIGNDNMQIGRGYMIDSLIGYATGEAGAVFKTIDSGEDWALEQKITSETINDICFPVYNDTINVIYACGNKGTILKYYNIVGVKNTEQFEPVCKFIQFEIPDNLFNIPFNLIVCNIIGETILTKYCDNPYNLLQSIEEINEGCYILLFKYKNGTVLTSKYIKTR